VDEMGRVCKKHVREEELRKAFNRKPERMRPA
jgi:hypothetical protein